MKGEILIADLDLEVGEASEVHFPKLWLLTYPERSRCGLMLGIDGKDSAAFYGYDPMTADSCGYSQTCKTVEIPEELVQAGLNFAKLTSHSSSSTKEERERALEDFLEITRTHNLEQRISAALKCSEDETTQYFNDFINMCRETQASLNNKKEE